MEPREYTTEEVVEHAERLLDLDPLVVATQSTVETVDGCTVEPDGSCPHGYNSPLIVLGVI